MVIAKLLQVSDSHDRGDLLELEAVVNLERETKPTATVFIGDITDGLRYRDMFVNAQKEVFTSVDMPTEEKQAAIKYSMVHALVEEEGEEKIRNEINTAPDLENRDQIRETFESYVKNKDAIQKILRKFHSDFGQKITDANKKILETILTEAAETDKKIGEMKSKILAVRGNHDLDSCYSMKRIHWLEKDGPVDLQGLLVAGAPNTMHHVKGIPAQLYSTLEEDIPISDIEKFIKETGTKEDIENFKKNNPVYQRLTTQLQGRTADMLVTHIGLGTLALEERKDGQKIDWGYGAGLALWVKDKVLKKEPLIMLSGHVHSQPLYVKEHGYQGLRSSNERAYVIHVNTETKQIEQIDVYKKVYEKISRKEYEAANKKAYEATKNPKKN